MKKIAITLGVLFLTLSCNKQPQTEESVELSLELKRDSIIIYVDSNDRRYIDDLQYFDDFNTKNRLEDLNKKIISDFPYIELTQEDRHGNQFLIPSIYWLRNGEEYIIHKDSITNRVIVKSENENLQINKEAMFFVELTDSVYLNTEYTKLYKEPIGLKSRFVMPLWGDTTDYQKMVFLKLKEQKDNLEVLKGTERLLELYKETYDKQLSFLDRRKENVSQEFYLLAKTYFHTNYISDICSFYRQQVTINRDNEEIKTAAKEMLKKYMSELIDDNLLFSPSYKSNITDFYAFKFMTDKNLTQKNTVENIEGILAISRACDLSENYEYLLFTYTNLKFDIDKWQKKDEFDPSFLNTYFDSARDESYKNYLRLKLTQYEAEESVKKGKLGNNILHTADLKKIELDELIKSYEGKYIYLDFWASWCTPCRALMPKSKEYAEKYKNDVVFLYISTDTDFTAWDKAVNIEGISRQKSFLISDKSDFAKTMKIKTIPRYMIFDRQGKLIDGDAIRPDDSNFEQKFDKLI